MTDRDEVRELADWMREKQRRGEKLEPDFRLAWDGFTDEERDDFMSLQSERIAQRKERLGRKKRSTAP